jgi:hypothetical protein
MPADRGIARRTQRTREGELKEEMHRRGEGGRYLPIR